MHIKFDNQTIEYLISLSYIDHGVKIDITYTSSVILKNEERMKSLEQAILHEHNKIIQRMIRKVAKDGKPIIEVNLAYEAPVYIDSLNFANTRDSFFFNAGVIFKPGATVSMNPEEAGLEESIRAGKPFSVCSKNCP
jgi:hypothetical protein